MTNTRTFKNPNKEIRSYILYVSKNGASPTMVSEDPVEPGHSITVQSEPSDTFYWQRPGSDDFLDLLSEKKVDPKQFKAKSSLQSSDEGNLSASDTAASWTNAATGVTALAGLAALGRYAWKKQSKAIQSQNTNPQDPLPPPPKNENIPTSETGETLPSGSQSSDFSETEYHTSTDIDEREKVTGKQSEAIQSQSTNPQDPLPPLPENKIIIPTSKTGETLPSGSQSNDFSETEFFSLAPDLNNDEREKVTEIRTSDNETGFVSPPDGFKDETKRFLTKDSGSQPNIERQKKFRKTTQKFKDLASNGAKFRKKEMEKLKTDLDNRFKQVETIIKSEFSRIKKNQDTIQGNQEKMQTNNLLLHRDEQRILQELNARQERLHSIMHKLQVMGARVRTRESVQRIDNALQQKLEGTIQQNAESTRRDSV